MSTSAVEFPLSPIKSKEGVVAEPIIPVSILTNKGFRLYDFLVDSGADFTLLPRSLAGEIGIRLKDCVTSTTLGVEGRGIKIYYSKIVIQIGDWKNTIRCAFASHDRVPPLLGRLDLFSRYNITFHAQRRSVIFENILFPTTSSHKKR